jgi:hypothetical protein
MNRPFKYLRLGSAAMLFAAALASLSPNLPAMAQTTSAPAPAAAALSEPTVRALQEALRKQGISVTVSGVLNDETRAAIRKYQSLHHLPVTGEPDKATLAKLGVAVQQGGAPAQPSVTAQTSPPADTSAGQAQTEPPPSQMPGGMPMGGMMMGGPMMQGMMKGMMQTMQGMMGMMRGQMQPGPTPAPMPGPMGPPQGQGGMMMNCPMMSMMGGMQGSAPAMMQMMQGMMQMMQMMQSQMPPGRKP